MNPSAVPNPNAQIQTFGSSNCFTRSDFDAVSSLIDKMHKWLGCYILRDSDVAQRCAITTTAATQIILQLGYTSFPNYKGQFHLNKNTDGTYIDLRKLITEQRAEYGLPPLESSRQESASAEPARSSACQMSEEKGHAKLPANDFNYLICGEPVNNPPVLPKKVHFPKRDDHTR